MLDKIDEPLSATAHEVTPHKAATKCHERRNVSVGEFFVEQLYNVI